MATPLAASLSALLLLLLGSAAGRAGAACIAPVDPPTASPSPAGSLTPTWTPTATAMPVPEVIAEALDLPAGAFGGSIEGAAVNAAGDVYAADFQGGGAPPSTAVGLVMQGDRGTERVRDPVQASRVVLSQGALPSRPLVAGGRFLPDGGLLLTDAANGRLVQVHGAGVTVACADAGMLQPNDVAVSPPRRVGDGVSNRTVTPTAYLSGQRYTANTTAGASGELWSCRDGQASRYPPAMLAAAGIHRTNGIEVSPDGSTLYLTDAANSGGVVTTNRIFRFAIDVATGRLSKAPPVLFFAWTGDDASVDADGMRVDVRGNLYVTRNGVGAVEVLSPAGALVQVIRFPTLGGPSNVAFGGPLGGTLVAIGRCAANSTAGCAAAYETNTVGRAWRELQ
ncbi:hypothetical protein MMPV_000471 [Pyropia vietnamensis]